jgi:short-subunit dehydrogenase involved in D-alanine esterification of teichoic acids
MVEHKKCLNKNLLNHRVFFAGCRNPKEAKKSVEQNIEKDLIKDRVYYEVCDTSDVDTVKKFAEIIKLKYPAINLLINNGKNYLKNKSFC